MIILFDFDGTLIDATSSIFKGFKNAFEKNNLLYPGNEKVKELIGYPLEIIFSTLGVSDENLQKCLLSYKEIYEKTYLDDTKLLPGAKEAILEASKIADLGIVTTKTSEFTIKTAQHLNIKKYFKVIIGKDDVKNLKPHKEPIILAIKTIGNYKNKKIFMIGDTKLDLKAARNAGIQGIGVTCGYGKNLEKYTNLIFDSTKEAVNFLKNL